jgi:hypothetical protein
MSTDEHGWRKVEVGPVRFDLYGTPPRFLRIRNRDLDCEQGRAYVVIDLFTRKMVKDQTEFRPRENGAAKEG